MTESDSTPQIVILCSDMLFLSKITGTARELGYTFCTALSCNKAAASLSNETRQLLLIDLTQQNLDWGLLESIHQRNDSISSIAFGPHVNTERLAKASEIGCTQVLPRSQFSAQLPRLIDAAFD
jgi:DNA-binding NtrC family response regulator